MLTRRDIFRLVVKFVGLLILARTFVDLLYVALQLPAELEFLAEQGRPRGIETLFALVIARFGYPAVYLLVGLAAIWWGNRAFHHLEPTESFNGPTDATDLLKLEAVLYGLLGTYLIVDGTALLFGILSESIFHSLMNQSPILDQLISQLTFRNTLWGFAKIAFGILLILRKEGMAALGISTARWIKAARHWPN